MTSPLYTAATARDWLHIDDGSDAEHVVTILNGEQLTCRITAVLINADGTPAAIRVPLGRAGVGSHRIIPWSSIAHVVVHPGKPVPE